MSETGRYYITDPTSGRKFCIEPIHGRNQKANEVAFKNGHGGDDGLMGGVKGKPIQGGSISEDESIITEENGFKDIVTIGPYMSPQAFIDDVCRLGIRLNDSSMKTKSSIVPPVQKA